MNESGGKSSTILLTVIGIATLLVVVVGATFAYFAAQVSGNDTVSTLTVTAAENGSRQETFTGAGVVIADKMYPKAEAWATQTVTLELTGSKTDAAGSLDYIFELYGTNNFPTAVNTQNLDGSTNSTTEVNLHDYIKFDVTNVSGASDSEVTVGKNTKVVLSAGPIELLKVNVPNNTNKTISFDVNLYFVEDDSVNQNDAATHSASFYVNYRSVNHTA